MTAPDYTDLCAQGEAAAIALAMRPKQRKVANLLADLIAAIRDLEAQLVQSGDRAAELMIQHMRRAEAAEAEVKKLTATVERMRGALEWYGEQSRLARLIHSEGDAGRYAIAADGGKRARAAITEESHE